MARLIDEASKDARWLLEDQNYSNAVRGIIRTNVQSLVITEGCEICDLSFLRELPELRSLSVDSKSVVGISALENASSLESLSLFFDINIGLNLCLLSELKSLQLKWPKRMQPSLDCLPKLDQLAVWGIPSPDLSALRGLSNVQDLWIAQSRKLKSLSGIEGCVALKSLTISNCPLLTDISGVKGLASLKSLELTSLKRLENLSDGLSDLMLERLIVDGLPPLKDFQFLGRSLGLRHLAVLNSKVLDGDFGVISKFTELEHFVVKPESSSFHPKPSAISRMIKQRAEAKQAG